MDKEEIERILADVKFPDYNFEVIESAGELFLQAFYAEADIVTKVYEAQRTRKWVIEVQHTKSQIVQTAFKCVLTSMEHRAREHFKYRGKRIFGPHFDVDALHQICADRRFDY